MIRFAHQQKTKNRKQKTELLVTLLIAHCSLFVAVTNGAA